LFGLQIHDCNLRTAFCQQHLELKTRKFKNEAYAYSEQVRALQTEMVDLKSYIEKERKGNRQVASDCIQRTALLELQGAQVREVEAITREYAQPLVDIYEKMKCINRSLEASNQKLQADAEKLESKLVESDAHRKVAEAKERSAMKLIEKMSM
jgi:hypothetical protein